jgi:RNA recognition motif-containing protein
MLIEMRIYIGNLNYRLRTEELKAVFEPYGEVIGAKIVRDKETNRSKGFGFIEMANEEDGRKALAALNETELGGRKMIVNEAKPREINGNTDTPVANNSENV